MKRVTGLGGVFFKAKEPRTITTWYDKHLGFSFGDNNWNTFKWRERENPEQIGRTEFSVFPDTTDYYAPSHSPFMLNFRVENLEKLLEILRGEGVTIVGEMEVYDYGKFGWILDPEGNKIELWQPIDSVLENAE
jgi:predicted enzyme related to lactoylglutathione lyase